MDWLEIVRWLHVLGACIWIGTGSGIAFFMVMAHRTRDPAAIAHTASVVGIADMVFTATAAIAQPISGAMLAISRGWSLSDSWLAASVALYVFIGLFWVPVIFVQIALRNEARAAARDGGVLSPRFQRLYRIWFLCGIPAFAAILALLWLMLTTPELGA